MARHWYDGDKQRTKRFATRREAERHIGDVARSKARGDTAPNLADWTLEWVRLHGSEWTDRTLTERTQTVARHINPYLGRRRLDHLTRQVVALRLTVEEIAALDARAEREGKTRSEVIREALASM